MLSKKIELCLLFLSCTHALVNLISLYISVSVELSLLTPICQAYGFLSSVRPLKRSFNHFSFYDLHPLKEFLQSIWLHQ